MVKPFIPSTPSALELLIFLGTRHRPHFIQYFLGFFPVHTLLVFGKVNRMLYHVIQDYVESQWNISDTLSDWFPSVTATRNVLDECGAVIGGSAVLGFFLRSRGVRQMDIFVQMRGVLKIGAHLITSGYVAHKKGSGRYSFSRAAFAASLLSKASAFTAVPTRQDAPIAEFPFLLVGRGPQLRVTVFAVRPEPVHFILSMPHSS